MLEVLPEHSFPHPQKYYLIYWHFIIQGKTVEIALFQKRNFLFSLSPVLPYQLDFPKKENFGNKGKKILVQKFLLLR